MNFRIPTEVKVTLVVKLNTGSPAPCDWHFMDACMHSLGMPDPKLLEECEMLPAENLKQRLRRWSDKLVDDLVLAAGTRAREASEDLKALADKLDLKTQEKA